MFEFIKRVKWIEHDQIEVNSVCNKWSKVEILKENTIYELEEEDVDDEKKS